MAGLKDVLPTERDLLSTKTWLFAGIGIGAGILISNWISGKLQGAGLTFPAQTYWTNTINTLPNSPYRSYASRGGSIRFNR